MSHNLCWRLPCAIEHPWTPFQSSDHSDLFISIFPPLRHMQRLRPDFILLVLCVHIARDFRITKRMTEKLHKIVKYSHRPIRVVQVIFCRQYFAANQVQICSLTKRKTNTKTREGERLRQGSRADLVIVRRQNCAGNQDRQVGKWGPGLVIALQCRDLRGQLLSDYTEGGRGKEDRRTERVEGGG